jgi:hypothetical protein
MLFRFWMNLFWILDFGFWIVWTSVRRVGQFWIGWTRSRRIDRFWIYGRRIWQMLDRGAVYLALRF